MIARAVLRYIRISPRKFRQVIPLVKGRNPEEAVAILTSVKKGASKYASDLIKSAMANAKRKTGRVDAANLYISKLIADCGPSLKRYRAASMGRASPILKRTSHLTVELDEIKSPVASHKPQVKERDATKNKGQDKLKTQKSNLKTATQNVKLKIKHSGPKDT